MHLNAMYGHNRELGSFSTGNPLNSATGTLVLDSNLLQISCYVWTTAATIKQAARLLLLMWASVNHNRGYDFHLV